MLIENGIIADLGPQGIRVNALSPGPVLILCILYFAMPDLPRRQCIAPLAMSVGLAVLLGYVLPLLPSMAVLLVSRASCLPSMIVRTSK